MSARGMIRLLLRGVYLAARLPVRV